MRFLLHCHICVLALEPFLRQGLDEDATPCTYHVADGSASVDMYDDDATRIGADVYEERHVPLCEEVSDQPLPDAGRGPEADFFHPAHGLRHAPGTDEDAGVCTDPAAAGSARTHTYCDDSTQI